MQQGRCMPIQNYNPLQPISIASKPSTMMASSSHSFLLFFPLLVLLSTVDSGSAPTPAPSATTSTAGANNDPQKLCRVALDAPSCIKVIESMPGIQEADAVGKIADLCLHFAANRTTEAKALADASLLAAPAAKEAGKPNCLKACATDLSSVAAALTNLPAGQDDMNAYLTAKDIRAKFKHEKPPACEKDCWNKSSSASSANNNETIIADKFHDIWNVLKVANSQINLMFPWPDSEDDDNDLV